MAMEMLKGSLLFETHDSYEHLALMEKLCGKFPDHMILGNKEALSRGTGRNEVHDFFTEVSEEDIDYSPKHKYRNVYPIDERHDEESVNHVKSRKSLKEQCKKQIVDDDKMVDEMVELCTMMLQLDPANRATASRCLSVNYFSDLNALSMEEIIHQATSLSFVYGDISEYDDELDDNIDEIAEDVAVDIGNDDCNSNGSNDIIDSSIKPFSTAPMMMPTAISMTLPLAMKSLNSFNIFWFPRYLHSRRNHYSARLRTVLTRDEHNTIPFFRRLSAYVQLRLTR